MSSAGWGLSYKKLSPEPEMMGLNLDYSSVSPGNWNLSEVWALHHPRLVEASLTMAVIM